MEVHFTTILKDNRSIRSNGQTGNKTLLRGPVCTQRAESSTMEDSCSCPRCSNKYETMDSLWKHLQRGKCEDKSKHDITHREALRQLGGIACKRCNIIRSRADLVKHLKEAKRACKDVKKSGMSLVECLKDLGESPTRRELKTCIRCGWKEKLSDKGTISTTLKTHLTKKKACQDDQKSKLTREECLLAAGISTEPDPSERTYVCGFGITDARSSKKECILKNEVRDAVHTTVRKTVLRVSFLKVYASKIANAHIEDLIQTAQPLPDCLQNYFTAVVMALVRKEPEEGSDLRVWYEEVFEFIRVHNFSIPRSEDRELDYAICGNTLSYIAREYKTVALNFIEEDIGLVPKRMKWLRTLASDMNMTNDEAKKFAKKLPLFGNDIRDPPYVVQGDSEAEDTFSARSARNDELIKRVWNVAMSRLPHRPSGSKTPVLLQHAYKLMSEFRLFLKGLDNTERRKERGFTLLPIYRCGLHFVTFDIRGLKRLCSTYRKNYRLDIESPYDVFKDKKLRKYQKGDLKMSNTFSSNGIELHLKVIGVRSEPKTYHLRDCSQTLLEDPEFLTNSEIKGIDPGLVSALVAVSEFDTVLDKRVKEISAGLWKSLSGRKWLADAQRKLKRRYSTGRFAAREERRLMCFGLKAASSFEELVESTREHIASLPVLNAYYCIWKHGRLRFTRHMMHQKALEVIAEELFETKKRAKERLEGGNPKTVYLAYGDATFSSTARKGHASMPVRMIKDFLNRKYPGRVIEVDEFRTTAKCSHCFSAIKHPVSHHHPTKKAVSPTRNSLSKGVVECLGCGVTMLRDTGAAKNMALKLVCLRDGKDLPPVFKR